MPKSISFVRPQVIKAIEEAFMTWSYQMVLSLTAFTNRMEFLFQILMALSLTTLIIRMRFLFKILQCRSYMKSIWQSLTTLISKIGFLDQCDKYIKSTARDHIDDCSLTTLEARLFVFEGCIACLAYSRKLTSC